MGGVGVGALLSLSGIGREVGWGRLLFEAGRLLTFSAFRMGANSKLGTYSNKYGIQRNMVWVFFFHAIPNLRFRQFEYVVCLRSVWLNVSVIKLR